MAKLVFKTEDAVKGGYRSIVEVEGDLTEVEFKEAGSFKSDQVQIVLENAVIREMEDGVPEPELPEGVFKCWQKYSGKPGVPPSDKSGYVISFLGSAEAQGVNLPPDAKAVQRVVIRKGMWDLGYEIKNEPVKAFGWQFMPSEASKPVDLTAYVAGLIVGKNKAMAVREVMLDAKAKRRPEYKEAIQNDTIGDLIPVVMDEAGLFQMKV